MIKRHFRFNICVSLIGFKFRSIQRNKHRMQLRFYNGLRYTDTSWMWRNLEDLAPEKRQTYSKVLEINFKGFKTPYKLCNYQLIHFKTSWDDLPLVTMLGLTFQYICGLPRNICNQSLVLRKTPDSNNRQTSYNIPNQCFSKPSRPSNTRNVLRRHDN